jgi:hypothetical protein
MKTANGWTASTLQRTRLNAWIVFDKPIRFKEHNMAHKSQQPVPPARPTQAPLDENPLAKPEKSRKDIRIQEKKSKTLKNDDWKI